MFVIIFSLFLTFVFHNVV